MTYCYLNKKIKSCLLLIGIVFLTIPFSLCGCKKAANNPVSKTSLAFDTLVTITIYDDSSEETNFELINECFDLCDYYENLFSRTIPTSEISKINSSKGNPVLVSDETIEIIEKGIYYGEISDGLFDITIAPVSTLWDFHGDTNSDINDSSDNNTANDSDKDSDKDFLNHELIPDNTAIEEAIKHVSYKNILIDKTTNTITLKDKNTQIDLGGIAKGYIADKIKEYLLEKGVKSALIDLGGNILALGSKPDSSPFKIGIKKPFNNNEIEASLDVIDRAVSTSGVYERFFLIDEKKINSNKYTKDLLLIDGKKLFHHILNPKTGFPAKTDLYGASVICEKSIDADALSTILILKGYDEGKLFIENIKNTDAIFSKAE